MKCRKPAITNIAINVGSGFNRKSNSPDRYVEARNIGMPKRVAYATASNTFPSYTPLLVITVFNEKSIEEVTPAITPYVKSFKF